MRDMALILINVLFTVMGHTMLKHGMSQVGRVTGNIDVIKSSFLRAASNPFVIFGLLVFVFTSMLWLVVLSRVPLSMAYPMLSLSYVIAILVSWLIFKEHIPWTRVVGAIIICGGVYLVSLR
ncbi:TPA: hypothetical protein EYP37_11440 [Candidatus Poribacteria bacterium]|nr:hypothetical protein [Candidatus Poribacteria bacterium]